MPRSSSQNGSRPDEVNRRPIRPYRLPRLYFRTLNGFKFWPIELPAEDQETSALRVLRVFEVQAPEGGLPTRCVIEVTTSVRGTVQAATGQDYPATAPMWDMVCKMALSTRLLESGATPAEPILVYGLDREQLRAVLALAGSDRGR